MEKVKNEHLEEVAGGLSVADLTPDQVGALQRVLGSNGAVICHNFDVSNEGNLGSGNIEIIRGFDDAAADALQYRHQIPGGVRVINGIRCVPMDRFISGASEKRRVGEGPGRDTGVTVAGRRVMVRNWEVTYGIL